MNHTRDEQAAMLAKELNGIANGLEMITSGIGWATLVVCLLIGGFSVYSALPELNALPHDLPPLAAMKALLKIHGFTLGAILMGLGIAIWLHSRPSKV